MNALERLKRKVVSRLTGEPDVIKLDSQIDGKVAIVRYKNREIIIEKRGNNFVMFNKTSDYAYWNDMLGYEDVEDAIEYARNFIKREDEQ